MAKSFDTTESFLGHSSRGKGTKFLTWKDDGELTCWLHTKQKPIAVWTHGFPRIFIKKDGNGEEQRVTTFGKYNCHEEEDVLKVQGFRNDDGSRKQPPQKCGMCKFLEWMRGQVTSGAIPWTKTIFTFAHEDPTKTIVIHAAGIYNGFKRTRSENEFTKEEKADLTNHGISLMRAWSESAVAKCEYVFTLVDNKHPESGVQIASETAMLGDKVKDVIVDMRESKGVEKGDPFLHPYAIKFIYNGEETNPQAKYKARPLEGIVLTPIIEKLIKSEPPDLERQIAPFNPKDLRTFLETHCLLKNVPWDDLFTVSDEEHTHDDDSDDHDAAEPEVEPEDEMVACDKCDKPMKATDTECKHCGAKYEVEGAAPPPPPPPEKPIRKRSEMKSEVKGQPGKKMPF